MTTMTQAEFARAKKVSRKTVTMWKKRGRLKMAGDYIDVERTQEHMKTFSSHRAKGAHAPVTQQPKSRRGKVTQPASLTSSDPRAYEGVPFAVSVVADAIYLGAFDLARILAEWRTPAADIVAIVRRWVEWTRFGWVGHALVPDPIVVTEAWPPPETGGEWRDHALFQGDPLSDEDWQAIDELHASATAQPGQADP